MALANRRFRTLILLMAGTPIALAYAWYGVVWPLIWNQVSDFRQVYLEGARVIAAGGDPYQCNTGFCSGHTQGWLGAAGAVYPPFPLWLTQPFAPFDPLVVDAFALVAANICLGLFIWVVVRSLALNDWQLRALIVLLSVSFAPTLTEVQNRNFQVLLLLLSGLVLVAWQRGDRLWGGAALGLGLAIKLVLAPVLLLGVWGRRWLMVVFGLATWAMLWLLAVPRLLPEYVFQVLPSVGRGSGEEMNVAPLAAVARLFHPESLYLQGRGVDTPVLAVTAAFVVTVLVLTTIRLRTVRPDPGGRALEVSTAFAAAPLLLTLVWAGQLILLLLPMIVLLNFGLRTGSRRVVAAVVVSWLLIGPVYLAFTNAFAIGFGFPILFQIWSDSALAGVVILWLATLDALRLNDRRAS
ncbi:MAG: hypothetical protein AUI15_19655 [Actinobacteria bacterium 13_2_20CM_2_66_6]|nr:MAG: hypothetical protein AUI15_19655 [Actinobacteria bacterium 13_2_20CM_2_66_6]